MTKKRIKRVVRFFVYPLYFIVCIPPIHTTTTYYHYPLRPPLPPRCSGHLSTLLPTLRSFYFIQKIGKNKTKSYLFVVAPVLCLYLSLCISISLFLSEACGYARAFWTVVGALHQQQVTCRI